jgi:hypothetical protein
MEFWQLEWEIWDQRGGHRLFEVRVDDGEGPELIRRRWRCYRVSSALRHLRLLSRPLTTTSTPACRNNAHGLLDRHASLAVAITVRHPTTSSSVVLRSTALRFRVRALAYLVSDHARTDTRCTDINHPSTLRPPPA